MNHRKKKRSERLSLGTLGSPKRRRSLRERTARIAGPMRAMPFHRAFIAASPALLFLIFLIFL